MTDTFITYNFFARVLRSLKIYFAISFQYVDLVSSSLCTFFHFKFIEWRLLDKKRQVN